MVGGFAMGAVKGRVTAGSRRIRGVLIETFDVPDGFGKSLPIVDRARLGNDRLRRLGSTASNESGEFVIQYDATAKSAGWYRSESSINLWLLVSACRTEAKGLEIVYQAPEVRAHAGELEYYPICLPADYVDVLNTGLAGQEDVLTPDNVILTYTKQVALEGAELTVSKDKFDKKLAVRKEFEAHIAPSLRQELSLVELRENGEPVDPDYVRSTESVRAKAERRMLDVMARNFEVDSEQKTVLSGRIALTQAQLEALDSDPSSPTIRVDEETLAAVLNAVDGSGENPEHGTQIVHRVNAIELFCREKTEGEKCLGTDGEPPRSDSRGHGSAGGDGGRPVVDGLPEDRRDRPGGTVTVESLKNELPRYIAEVLDAGSTVGNGSAGVSEPGTQLTEDDIRGAASFPSLTLPPGPADVPAYHDFYDLQIAFKPVWSEALDESLIDDAAAMYERYVENGGQPELFLNGGTGPGNQPGLHFKRPGLLGGLQALFALPALDPLVQQHIEITNEEWGALTTSQQGTMRALAIKIRDSLALLERNKLQGNDFSDGLTNDDLLTFNRTREYVQVKVSEFREQGERLVRVARAELERQAAGKPLVPTNRILSQLVARARSAYPFKYFAANKRQRSVNFGVLVTYRQRWTPTAYQVGELVKSLPLGPKEVRKYSKKIVRKEKRARKEIESNVESLRSETNSTTRTEAEIVQRAMEKTNFNASANGSFTIGVWSGGGSSGLTQDVEGQSAETKKSFHEAVVKAARELRNELKVEFETESTEESEFQESGEIMNPNDELTVTYLFYELQRRYRVEERLHRLTSVVLVAQEMPAPEDIDEDWLIVNRWILNRVLLDDVFKRPLAYVAEGQVAEEFALEELRKAVAQQRRLVEDLKEDIVDSRLLTESRYAALQRSMERTARATQRKSKSGGLFGFVRKLTTVGVVGDFVDRFIGGEAETPEAARIREAAAQDAYQRELQRLRDLEAQVAQTNASLARATEEYADRLSTHLGNLVRVAELKNHIKDNATHYMQAIWMHEPFQQRWLRLKDVPVPVLRRANRTYVISKAGSRGALANVAHLRTLSHPFLTTAEVVLGPEVEEGTLETVPLYEVCDIDGLLGFRANYMIFPMKSPNAITDFMMEPYVEKAAGGFGITDPDDLGNMSLDEFSEYVCCLKEKLSAEAFEALREALVAQLTVLLQSPLRDDEEIVVPMDAVYIEALPGSTPILENFKLFHRQVDAAAAQEDLRLKRMEKLRYAQRLLVGRLDDPAADARYEFTGNPEMDFAISQPGSGEGGGGRGGGGGS
jgi:hypothetical protein